MLQFAKTPLALAMTSLIVACGGPGGSGNAAAATPQEFDGAVAMEYVRKQLAFGPRVPGTPQHRATSDWLIAELQTRADTVIVQEWIHTTADGQRLPMRNVLARFAPGNANRVLYIAHWDTRPKS